MIIEGIILAAGLSSRAGTYKLTLELGGKTIIERCVEGMYNVCSKVIVVGGYNIEKLAPILDKYPNVELVYNETYRIGMFSSVLEGFKHTTGDRIFLIPGDYPFIDHNVYVSLLKLEGDIVIPTYKHTKGHPILISKNMVNLLLTMKNYNSLREFVMNQDFNTLIIVQDIVSGNISPIFIDEIGPLELQEKGFYRLLLQVLNRSYTIYISVRETHLEKIIDYEILKV